MTAVDSFASSVGVTSLAFQNFYLAALASEGTLLSLKWALNISGRAIGFLETVGKISENIPATARNVFSLMRLETRWNCQGDY
jgi:hypothetical protein